MNTFIILTAAILVIALVWFFTKESKTTDESYPLTQEDKEWLEAPLETPPTPEPVVEPVVEVVVEPVVETVVEPVVAPVAEVKPTVAPKRNLASAPQLRKSRVLQNKTETYIVVL